MRKLIYAGVVLSMSFGASHAVACSSCGCTLTTDWATQGFGAVTPGLRMDLRLDFLDQTDLRSGTQSVDRSSLPVPNDREIQQRTRNLNYSVFLDYTFNDDWGVTQRSHRAIRTYQRLSLRAWRMSGWWPAIKALNLITASACSSASNCQPAIFTIRLSTARKLGNR